MGDLGCGRWRACRRALELDPDLPEAHNSVGLALNAKGLREEAIAAYETAIRLRPHYHKAYNNLGILLHAQGRFSEALAAYTKAVALVSDYAEAQWNKGMLHLLLGEFEPGWRGYEYGLDMRRATRPCTIPPIQDVERRGDFWKDNRRVGMSRVSAIRSCSLLCYPTSSNVEPICLVKRRWSTCIRYCTGR